MNGSGDTTEDQDGDSSLCVSTEDQIVETRNGATGFVRAIPSVAAPSPSSAAQQFPSWTLSAFSPWREFISIKSSLFAGGDDFLSGLVHNKKNL